MAERVAAVVVGLLAWVFVVPTAAAPVVAAGVVNAPRLGGGATVQSGVANSGWVSSNWSGYAISGAGFTQVTGTWTVPAVTATSGDTYSSSWAGIDGYANSNLIQTGTEQDFVDGAPHYAAWWEIIPAAETIIPSITVHPGDRIHASVARAAGSTWTITLIDLTTGRSFTTSRSYSGPGNSAEWVEEAPSVGGPIAPLAHYGGATFDPGTVNGQNPRLSASESGAMVQNGAQVSTPSAPDSDTDGFNVAYGATAPPPPGS